LIPRTECLGQRTHGRIEPIDPRFHPADLCVHGLEKLMALQHHQPDQFGYSNNSTPGRSHFHGRSKYSPAKATTIAVTVITPAATAIIRFRRAVADVGFSIVVNSCSAFG